MGFVLISSNNFRDALWKLFSMSLPMFIVSKHNLSEVLLHLVHAYGCIVAGIANFSSQGSCDQVHSRT